MKRKKITLFTAIVLCLLVALTGCGSSEKPASETEKKVLVIGMGAELDNQLTPLSTADDLMPAFGMVYETLVTYHNGEYAPGLASSWEFGHDGREITLHLREGITYHDGEPFNADSVKANLEYLKGWQSAAFLRGVSSIQTIEVLDTYTLKLIYEAPYYASLWDLASPYRVTMISPGMYEEGNYESMRGIVGTGPYMYDTFVKGEYTLLKANPDYWGNTPQWDEIIVRYIPTSSSRLKALQTGEIDMIFSSDFISYDEYRQASGLNGIEGQISEDIVNTRNIVLNSASPVLSDASLRQAIAQAINKEAIVQGLTYGYEKTAEALFDTDLPYCNVTLNHTWSYDPEKSAQLLDESGWKLNESTGYREKDGSVLHLRFTYPNNKALNKEIVEAIGSQLGEVGIQVETEGMEIMSWYADCFQSNFDLTIGNTYGKPDDPHNYLNPIYTMGSIDAIAVSELPDVQQLRDWLGETLITAEEDRVTELYDNILNSLNDNVIEIPISYQMELVLYNSEVIEGYAFGGITQVLFPDNVKKR